MKEQKIFFLTIIGSSKGTKKTKKKQCKKKIKLKEFLKIPRYLFIYFLFLY